MWPDICNIFSHFHCWLVVPPPSWSSGALCTVPLSSCALCKCALCAVHCALVHCATPLPVLWWWDPRAQNVTNNFVTTFLLLRALCTFCQRNQRRRWESSSFEKKICPYRGYRSSSYSKYNFRLPKKTEKHLFFQHLTLGCPKQTNKTNNFVFNIWNPRLCALMGERTSSLGEGRRDLLMDSWWTGICHIFYLSKTLLLSSMYFFKTVDAIELLMNLWL